MPIHAAKFIKVESRQKSRKQVSKIIETHIDADGKITVSLLQASPDLIFVYNSEEEFYKEWKIVISYGEASQYLDTLIGYLENIKEK